MLTKETEGIQIGIRLLATQIQSLDESEALQALSLLDTCMKRCGPLFHAEVGKFRFLNEMIKLVSPKYLGNRTTADVRQKVLQLLYSWIREYPRESKIKEAYEMLKKQGVIEEDAAFIMASSEESQKSSKIKNIFENEEMSRHLRTLLYSKDPSDLQTANRLIKFMVKEDEARLQLHSQRSMELESVQNNVILLSEMLDSYNQNETSAEDLELIKELYQACERLKPVLLRLASETQGNVEMLGDVLAASDELNQVFEKYTSVIILGQLPKSAAEASKPIHNELSLLDLSFPTEIIPCKSSLSTTQSISSTDYRSDMDVLGDIFNTLEKPVKSEANFLMPNAIMQPTSILPINKKNEVTHTDEEKIDSKAKALEELNELGESLLKQSLSGTVSITHSSQGKTNSNVTKVQSICDPIRKQNISQDSNNISQHNTMEQLNTKKCERNSNMDNLASSNSSKIVSTIDVCQKNSNSEITNAKIQQQEMMQLHNGMSRIENTEPEIKPLTDITVCLEDIKPGINPPVTVIEEKNGISVVLHFTQDTPRSDVSVIVITTMSKNAKPLSNYLFQAVVPKKCKCRLQTPSGTKLPAHNPFLPPSAITQIMLIANPLKEPISLKFMLSYTMDDETFTEMGEVDTLPHL
ncbi:PREDICTED: ADP-ribosylation factor-binding protein GGA3 isoform X2 [Vollenhovia emeryi]|nr:PREDICTED: ADP-ribosylation factor-binding protein GGA3 isoform X2 [Vollenhovia emeryi]